MSNAAGHTIIFLVNEEFEEFDRVRARGIEGIGIYHIECEVMAKQAYELLEYARVTPACRPNDGPTYESRCRLALRGLPEIVNKVRWDVVVVDGPGRGGGPEEPGRMAAIYTAALLARAGNSTDVLVHNVDRTIEKWYSWSSCAVRI
uniref:Uncharacterized protein n=1 Tax=Ananas comosus var. bracteatus TaxID=296719 RepID=A0A6V7P0N1_ANACO|nr:unnamed protein product [Ananas comosus var. bracteatus]